MIIIFVQNLNIAAKTTEVVIDPLNIVSCLFDKKFSQVFKNITGHNGSGFANLSTLEN